MFLFCDHPCGRKKQAQCCCLLSADMSWIEECMKWIRPDPDQMRQWVRDNPIGLIRCSDLPRRISQMHGSVIY